MATAFEVALQNFQNYAYTVSKEFGDGITSIIAAKYVSQMGRPSGLGDGDIITGSSGTSTLADDGSSDLLSNNPIQNTVKSIGDFVNSVSGTLLKSAQTYYNTQIQLSTLKTQAAGAQAATNAVKSIPSAWILWGAVGLGALLLMRR